MSAKLNVDIVAQLKDFNKAMSELKSEVDGISKSVVKSNNESIASTKKMSSTFSEVGSTLASVFAVDQLLSFGKAILDTTVEFQKMEAVLTTALGSNSAAKAAMDQIVNFASSTPFQVNELTDSFVKLANRGFVPTMEQMRQMGDLASSVGKSFDQLTEAILDAQTGEFERLKEFGVKASAQGDVVQFTFKGITTEVAKSDKAIQEYILSLGQLEGVSGSMEAIAATTGGAISNLQDNITQLFKSIGESSSGFINWFVKDLNNVISSLRNMGEIIELMNPFKTIAESSDEARTYLLRVNDSTNDLTRTVKDAAAEFDKLSLSFLVSGEGQTKFLNEMIKLGNTVQDSKALYQTYVKLRKEQAKSEEQLAGATATTTAQTKVNTAETEKQAAARQKAHEQRVEQLKKEEEAIQKLSRSYEIGFEDITFATKDFNDRIQNLALGLKNDGATTTNAETPNLAEGITYTPEMDEADKLHIQNAMLLNQQFKEQRDLGLEMSGIFGPLLAQSFTEMFETGQFGFASLLDGLKKMAIQLAATAAAAFALNLLLGGVGLKAFGAGSGGFKKIFQGLGGGGQLSGLIPMANGGIVSGPTAALVGEYSGARTNPEVIAPLSKLQNMMGGNVTFTISGDSLVGTLNRANKTRARKF
jgi:CII-binding regulator of phage lambda lysogenization HflD